jgi:hypothetical protein
VLWKQESFVVRRPLQIEFFRNLLGPNQLKHPPPGFPPSYPAHEVITVNGITEIIEHRKMEPIFYITDDPAVWKELGVGQK